MKDKIVVTTVPSLISSFTLWSMACSCCVSYISNFQNSTLSLSISIFVLSSSLSTESISSLVEGEEKFFFYFFLRRKTWEVLVFNFRKINIWLDRKKMQTNFFISINLIFINTTINDLLGIISFNVLTP
jgi:expansin (peptidoglycan-binding protein)